MNAYRAKKGWLILVDECEFVGGGILEAVMAFVRHNIQQNGATVFEVVPTEPWLQAAHTVQPNGSPVRESSEDKMAHNLAIGSETFDAIDVEGFNALSKEDKERVLGIGVRKLWKALHMASVRPNAGCIELAMKVLNGSESLAAQFCLLAQAYKDGIVE